MSSSAQFKIGILCAVLLLAGCSRTHYRIRADRETYGILQEKTYGRPWVPSPGFTIFPHPGSRFFDPTPIDDPALPVPSPQLYAYKLPEIPKRDASRFRPKETSQQTGSQDAQGPEHGKGPTSPSKDSGRITRSVEMCPPIPYQTQNDRVRGNRPNQLVAFQNQKKEDKKDKKDDAPKTKKRQDPEDEELQLNPIPKDVWESIPEKCLKRMFEFESVRQEYQRTREAYKEQYGKELPEPVRDKSKRLALEDIIKLGLINSREYQTQKEQLYAVALALTFERYQYALKFDPLGNGTFVEYVHNRTAGIETNTLSVPTQFNGSTILATGGTLVSRFANNVFLTFNGPEGFAMDVTSEMLFDVTQSVFQRDIVFEALTQNERDVVYAARDYARFRKTFFRNLAVQYYNLLTTYRNIEIATQDYFSNQRAFAQLEAEFLSGKLFGGSPRSRVQVDQIEQQALASRNNLIAVCNTLASALDNLKLAIGVPPETPLNLDLTELEEITLRDQTTIETDLVRRAGRILRKERERILRQVQQGTNGALQRERATLLNFSIELARRLVGGRGLRKRLGQKSKTRSQLEVLLAEMLVEDARLAVRFDREVLATQNKARPELVYGRTIALVNSLQRLIDRQLILAELKNVQDTKIAPFRAQEQELGKRLDDLRKKFETIFNNRDFKKIPELLKTARQRLVEAEELAKSTARLVPRPNLTPRQQFEKTLATSEALLTESEAFVTANTFGLTAVELEMDDAMLTAVTQRYDLMNLRGLQADAWRRIKLAADDLKSILNLRATQILRTDPIKDRPFGFNADNLETRLSLQFDAPLNRKAQRNAFRLALINYQAALRAKIALEDTIKLAIRDDLRDLDLDRQQYRIEVSSAALAFERVRSTRVQLPLGLASARDFVEAQQAKTRALSDVTSRHIGYIQNRIDLFLDLELLTVDENGFWEELYDEKYQPTPRYQLPMVPPYGVLPHCILYSHKVKRMLHVPIGETINWNPDLGEPEDPKADDPEGETPTQKKSPSELLPPPTPTEGQVLVPYFPTMSIVPSSGVSLGAPLSSRPVGTRK